MDQISAADRLVILVHENRWQLVENGGNDGPQLLLDVMDGQALRYNALFGSTRRLPSEGALTHDQVQRVVLGWSAKDESWHLGLLLETELANSRNSRWCELCRWPDPERDTFLDLGIQTGEALAGLLDCPFNLIPAKDQPAPPPIPKPTPLSLSLPVSLGEWRAVWADGQAGSYTDDSDEPRTLEFQRGRSWALSQMTRIAWYSLWIVAYLLLSFATFSRALALPNSGTMLPSPEILPYLGIGTALILIGMVIYLLFELFSRPNRIVIDPASQTVTALRGRRKRWGVNTAELQSIYVTQIVGKKGRKARVEHGELNLHFGGNKFQKVLEQDDFNQKRPWVIRVEPGQDGIVPITGEIINTEVEAIGLYVARVLGGLPCWYDQRGK